MNIKICIFGIVVLYIFPSFASAMGSRKPKAQECAAPFTEEDHVDVFALADEWLRRQELKRSEPLTNFVQIAEKGVKVSAVGATGNEDRFFVSLEDGRVLLFLRDRHKHITAPRSPGCQKPVALLNRSLRIMGLLR